MSKEDFDNFIKSEQDLASTQAGELARRAEAVRNEVPALQKEVKAAVLKMSRSNIEPTPKIIAGALEALFFGHPVFSDRVTIETVPRVTNFDVIRLRAYGVEIINHWDGQGLRFKIRVGQVPFFNR